MYTFRVLLTLVSSTLFALNVVTLLLDVLARELELGGFSSATFFIYINEA